MNVDLAELFIRQAVDFIYLSEEFFYWWHGLIKSNIFASISGFIILLNKRFLIKTKLTVIAFLLFPLFAQAQTFQIDKSPLPIDSLKKILPSLQGSAKVDCLIELTQSCMQAAAPIQFDSALSLARQAYMEASAIKYIKGLGDVCVLYGEIYSWYDTYIPEAEKYYREAIYWHEKIKNDNGLGLGFRGLGCVLLWRGSLDTAMETFEQSAAYFRKAGNKIMLADLNDWFGHVYQFKGDLEKHFEYVKKGAAGKAKNKR